MITTNPILNADSYKASHWMQYPPGTSGVFAYIESRGGRYDSTVFFGLQAFIQEYLSKPVTLADIDEAEAFLSIHGEPFNRAGWEHIVRVHDGFLPLRIRAVPEGSVVPTNNVLVTIESTDPECYWTPSYVESPLLRSVWYPTTVATQSWDLKQLIRGYLEETGDVSGLPFKLHDFGARGVSSFESAALGGMSHLVNFQGTDTMSGVLAAMRYYDATVCGFSIPAAEHSTISSWLRSGEADAYRNMLRLYGGEGKMFAVVSDTYDIYNATGNIWGDELKQEVIDSGSMLIVRPDSGDPTEVVTKVVSILADKFGYVRNSKGYKVLNNVRVIQGDGVNPDSIKSILTALKLNGFSADNIAFGMGGKLLQGVDRDTQKFAMKTSAVKIDDKWVPVFKDPVTDSGKRSKPGRVTLYKDRVNGKYFSGVEDWEPSALVTVYENGQQFNRISFDQVRANSEA